MNKFLRSELVMNLTIVDFPDSFLPYIILILSFNSISLSSKFPNEFIFKKSIFKIPPLLYIQLIPISIAFLIFSFSSSLVASSSFKRHSFTKIPLKLASCDNSL